jgi:hypothetical protein
MKPSLLRALASAITIASFAACGTDLATHRNSLGKVTVNETVQMSAMAYGNRNSTGTIVAAGVAGGAIGGAVVALVEAAANRGFESEFGETANIHDYDLREALRMEFPSAVNRRNSLPQKVTLAKDLTSLSGEEMAAARGDARFYLSVSNYGFGAMPFAKTLTPFLTVSVVLQKNGEEIWGAEARTRKGTLPSGTAEQFRTNPELVRRAWAAAARDVSEQLADAFARDLAGK